MVRSLRLIICIAVLITLVMPLHVSAGETDNIKDYLNYLNDEQLRNIQNSISSIGNRYNLDVVIVITNDTKGKSSRDYADDFFDNNGYGFGSDHSGLLMLLNMNAREVWISTTGRAIDIFTDSRIEIMVSNITKYLSGAAYYNACNQFTGDVSAYASKGIPENQYRIDEHGNKTYSNETNSRQSYMGRALILMKSVYVYVIAVMISLITTILITISNKGKVTVNNQTYEEKGSFKLKNSSDIFIRKNINRILIETNNKSGGGSSTHTGSSGRSHGGGGGRF